MGWDVYKRSLAPGPRVIWAVLAATLFFVSLVTLWKRQQRAMSGHDDGSLVTDAKGHRRTVAYVESAGILAKDLPGNLRRDLLAAGTTNLFTQYKLPGVKTLVLIVCVLALFTTLYWGAVPQVGVIFSIGMFTLLGLGYTSRPTQMSRVYLGHGHCPSCAYRLVEVPRQADGTVICPECGGAWMVPDQNTIKQS